MSTDDAATDSSPDASSDASPDPSPDPGQPLAARWLGQTSFDDALALQLETREAVVAGTQPNTLLLVEHPAVLTLGRRGDRTDILWTDAQLRDRGVAVAETPRGGQVTLHAPGQLVVYPVVKIGRRIRQHLQDLGAVSVALLTELGCPPTEFRMEDPGVWTAVPGEAVKLGSVGVHISRGVAVQGISLNLNVDPALFGALVSCGASGTRMVSAADLGATVVSVEAAARRWAALWALRTACTVRWPPEGS